MAIKLTQITSVSAGFENIPPFAFCASPFGRQCMHLCIYTVPVPRFTVKSLISLYQCLFSPRIQFSLSPTLPPGSQTPHKMLQTLLNNAPSVLCQVLLILQKVRSKSPLHCSRHSRLIHDRFQLTIPETLLTSCAPQLNLRDVHLYKLPRTNPHHKVQFTPIRQCKCLKYEFPLPL